MIDKTLQQLKAVPWQPLIEQSQLSASEQADYWKVVAPRLEVICG
jgi:hypothetical protein